jgi:hypothetical protein
MRIEISRIVSSFIKQNDLDYADTWRKVYAAYEEEYNIPVATWYSMTLREKNLSKLDFLESYEELYGTLTKMYNLVKELET